jgi:cytochrome c-type biogenesis protein CcmE
MCRIPGRGIMSPMRTGRFLIGAVVIMAAVSYLVYAGIRETSVYYLKFDEFAAEKANFVGEPLRVAGRVQQGTMKWDARSLDLQFGLGGFPAEDGTPATESPVAVQFNGILPDMFAEGRDVIVEGVYSDDDTFTADTIMTSCPSKYEPEVPES